MLATSGIGIHINARGGIEPCGILHYFDSCVKKGEAIEVSVSKSKVMHEIRTLYTSSTSCPLIDRSNELLQLIKRGSLKHMILSLILNILRNILSCANPE